MYSLVSLLYDLILDISITFVWGGVRSWYILDETLFRKFNFNIQSNIFCVFFISNYTLCVGANGVSCMTQQARKRVKTQI